MPRRTPPNVDLPIPMWKGGSAESSALSLSPVLAPLSMGGECTAGGGEQWEGLARTGVGVTCWPSPAQSALLRRENTLRAVLCFPWRPLGASIPF